MGGMISQEYAYKYPTSLASLTLISTHAGGVRAITPLRGISLFFRATMGNTEAMDELFFGSYTPTKQARESVWKRQIRSIAADFVGRLVNISDVIFHLLG